MNSLIIQKCTNGWIVREPSFNLSCETISKTEAVWVFKNTTELANALPGILEPPKPVNNPDGAM